VKAAARLLHPNIVAAFDAGEQNGLHYLVMELVDGHSLSQLVEIEGPLPVQKAADYIAQAARGLHYAHRRGLIHRDVKPGNLMLDRAGTVKILDLGTARFGDASGSELTQAGVIMGTVNYMSPEQARSPGDIDARTDIYSLGCTLYYLLVGRPMYAGDLIQTLLAHAQAPIPALRESRPDVPRWLEQIFRRMVAKAPDQRYGTMSQVLAELEEAGIAGGEQTGSGTTAKEGPGRLAEITTGIDQRPSRPEPAVGIDLGSSYCSIAYLDKQGNPQTLLDSRGQSRISAMVMIDGMNVAIGQEAQRGRDQPLDKSACDIKRAIGLPSYPRPLGETRYPPEILAGLLLARLIEEARWRIGDFRRAVVSVPAHFDEVRRKSVQDAGYIAGLQRVDIVNEPLAAAVALGYAYDFLNPPGRGDRPLHTLVIDLGGGMLDATVMDIDEADFRERATAGDSRLGGRDWDERLVDLVAERCKKIWGEDPRRDAVQRNRLAARCERAKIQLSEHDQVSLEYPLQSGIGRIDVTRDEFEQATVDLVERFGEVVARALDLAASNWTRIDRVLLSGGGARMPMIRQALDRLAGRSLTTAEAGRDCVAHGAALFAGARRDRQAGREDAFRTTPVNSLSLGLVGIKRGSGRRHNAVLIPRNTPLPASRKKTFKTQRTGQESVVLQIIQGEQDEPEACVPIGKCVIENLPGDLPAGSPVTVEFHYAANGRLTVYVESAATGYRVTKEICRAGGLADAALPRWREWVETVILCSNFF
jgi:molecular chaperone DnaK